MSEWLEAIEANWILNGRESTGLQSTRQRQTPTRTSHTHGGQGNTTWVIAHNTMRCTLSQVNRRGEPQKGGGVRCALVRGLQAAAEAAHTGDRTHSQMCLYYGMCACCLSLLLCACGQQNLAPRHQVPPIPPPSIPMRNPAPLDPAPQGDANSPPLTARIITDADAPLLHHLPCSTALRMSLCSISGGVCRISLGSAWLGWRMMGSRAT